MRRWLVAASLLVAALAGWAAHARAELGQQLSLLGAELSALNSTPASESSLTVNGAELDLVTLSLPLSIREVLDRFDTQCAREAPALAANLGLAHAGSLVRQETSTDGVAVCLAQPTDTRLRGLLDRAQDYARTHDLSVFGQLRYVRARRNANGVTHVLFAYSRGPLPLAAMFPAQGDAAGSDIAGLPRPQAARRLLSAQLSSTRYGMVAYAVSDRAEAALDAYARTLERNGFVQLEVAPAGSASRVFASAEQLYVVHSRRRDRDSVLSAVRVGRNAAPQPLPAAGTALAKELGQRD
jgi:hypothetical protein